MIVNSVILFMNYEKVDERLIYRVIKKDNQDFGCQYFSNGKRYI